MLSDPHACFLLIANLARGWEGGQHTAFCASPLRMMHLKAVPLRPMDHTLALSTFVPTEHSSPFKNPSFADIIRNAGTLHAFQRFSCEDLWLISAARQFSKKKRQLVFDSYSCFCASPTSILSVRVYVCVLSACVCVSAVDMTTEATLVSVCLPGSRGYVCFPQLYACLSQSEQKTFGTPHVFLITHSPVSLARDRRGARGREGIQHRGGRSRMEGKRTRSGLDVMWKEISVRSMLLYIGIYCQYTILRVMPYSPDGNIYNADFV